MEKGKGDWKNSASASFLPYVQRNFIYMCVCACIFEIVNIVRLKKKWKEEYKRKSMIIWKDFNYRNGWKGSIKINTRGPNFQIPKIRFPYFSRRIDCTCCSFRSSGWFPNIFSLAGNRSKNIFMMPLLRYRAILDSFYFNKRQ